MNPSYGAGVCPQCGCPMHAGAHPAMMGQGMMGMQPGGFPGMGMMGGFGPGGWGGPYAGSWFGPYAPGFQGWGPGFQGWGPGFQGGPGMMGGYGPWGAGFGLGGLRQWGGTYSPQYATTGLPTDEEITEMIYDAMDADPLVPSDADIDVGVDAGTVTLTGTVPNKRVKHAAGDDAWWIAGVTDVRNDLEVSGRRRGRGGEAARVPAEQAQPTGAARRRTTRG